MKTYVVATEVYERHGPGEIKVRIFTAKDLNDLATQLEPELIVTDADKADLEEGETLLSPWEQLQQMNGDGSDFHVVHELTVKDDKSVVLGELLVGEMQP